ncbi:outer membrane beta-barrel protein [Niabella aurantiaca]|uniref:outer membrane beta-barrel protein n=1 Tax=Niabella aurantiaca TaxID=379900 RepID=UPI00146B0193|nr:outer membrane beta-barrel protein [Niabella aurantiaca]
MKKDTPLRILICCTLFLSVPATQAQTRVSVTAGFNLSRVSWKESRNGTSIDNAFNPGYQLGLLTSVPVMLHRKSLHLQTGLLFSTKGFRQDYEDDQGQGVLVVNPWYGEIPLNILYRIPGNTERFFLGAGAYFAYGLGGRWTMTYRSAWGWDTGTIEYTDISRQDPDDQKFNYGRRTDLGINLLAGLIISKSVFLKLTGQAGLKNIAPAENKKMTKEEFRNRVLTLSAGYRF